jgi:hypothetical protein
MVHAVTQREAEPTRFRRYFPDGAELWRTEFFGPPPSPRGERLENGIDVPAAGPEGDALDPQSFLVEQGAAATVPTHFHHVNQFQVVVAGGGTLGGHAVDAVTVHYAGAYTAYGPIVAGPAGLTYFTLRAQSDTTGAQFLPQSRDRMKRVPRRYLLAERIALSERDALAALKAPVLDRPIDEADGIGAFVLRLPPGAAARVPDPALGGGQSCVVATGSMRHGGRLLGRWACLFVAPDEAALDAVAGPDGLELMILQYPRRNRPA